MSELALSEQTRALRLVREWLKAAGHGRHAWVGKECSADVRMFAAAPESNVRCCVHIVAGVPARVATANNVRCAYASSAACNAGMPHGMKRTLDSTGVKCDNCCIQVAGMGLRMHDDFAEMAAQVLSVSARVLAAAEHHYVTPSCETWSAHAQTYDTTRCASAVRLRANNMRKLRRQFLAALL